VTNPHGDFRGRVREALAGEQLQRALSGLKGGLVAQRTAAKARLPEFEELRSEAANLRDHTLANLDAYLEAFEEQARAAGSHVHWASDAKDAQDMIVAICQENAARRVTKGKSMVSEEIGLNRRLETEGLDVVETDLGEYLVQIRDETPSHIIAPAIHLSKEQVAEDFRRHHSQLPQDRSLDDPAEMVAEARTVLREKFLAADVGITGANFLVAETGSSVIVTNEGNGDLTALFPKVHIVLASIDKVVPTLADTALLLRLLARSGTGQDITAYTTFFTGPRRAEDLDGPEACHVIIVDNGRTELMQSEFREILRCIRCGACMNHCPVYGAIGGHAYDSVYAGPIGAVLTPAMVGIGKARDLPGASSFCGRCEDVCPVKIPLPMLLRRWREADFAGHHTSRTSRLLLSAWAYCAARPRLYRTLSAAAVAALSALGRGKGAFRWLPFAGAWTQGRDFPVPQGRTFQSLWQGQRQTRRRGRSET
jgi:L-lactate dehydrogenase complex protein LldF